MLSRDVTQFQRVERMRREFVANVSHELRTPLTVVSGFLETLRDETDAAAARRYIALMEEQSKRMQRLVEDLLTLSALESSPPPPMEEAVDMHALMERKEVRVSVPHTRPDHRWPAARVEDADTAQRQKKWRHPHLS